MIRGLVRLALIVGLLVAGPVLAQEGDDSVVRLADTVTASGLRLVDGVRYAISAFQPSGPANRLVAEIALPPDAVVVEAFDTESLVYRGTRTGVDGISLIWTAETLPADLPLGPFAFTLREPLAEPASVFIQWTGEDPNEIRVISTYAAPVLVEAANDIDRLIVSVNGTGEFEPVGTTGVSLYVAPGVVSEETAVLVGEMSTDLNPPPEYGAIWWCSGLALAGLPEGAAAQVIVPLRRPLPPLTETTLFALQPDNTWRALPDKGIVTLDGQSVAYVHPGGVIATGVEGELRPEEQAPVEVPPQDAPPPPPPPAEPPPPVEPPPPPPDVVLPANPPPAEPPPADQPPAQPPPTDAPPPTTPPVGDAVSAGDSSDGRPTIPTAAFTRELIQITAPTNTLLPTLPPPSATPAPLAAPTQAGIADGSSNTLLFGEVTATPSASGDGSVRLITPAPSSSATPVPTLPAISDGSSNTIIIGELTPTPLPDSQALPTVGLVTLAPFNPGTPTATTAGISDGSSNTILIGEVSRTPTPTRAGVNDGSSNTILIGEASRTPTPALVTLAPFTTATPTAASITDGSSNTILIGENTHTATPALLTLAPFLENLTPTPLPDSVAVTALATATPTASSISDGTSNTLLIGEVTATPAPPTSTPTTAPLLQFVTLAPFVQSSATPASTALPTTGSITDGSSNTLLVGESTLTPTIVVDVPNEVDDMLSTIRQARDQVQARGGDANEVAVQAIGQVFPQIGPAATAASTPTLASLASATPLPSATPSITPTVPPRPTRTPRPTETFLTEPSIRFALPAPACAASAPGAPFCVAADQTIRTCTGNACLSRRVLANQICIQLAGQSQPVCARLGP